MKELKTSKTVKNIANLSVCLIILILISSVLPDKVVYGIILLTGVISVIGFILLIKEKEKRTERTGC